MKKLPSTDRVKKETQEKEWGPREFKTHDSHREGSIMLISSKKFSTIQKENTIKHAAEAMSKEKTRRVFVAGPNKELAGIVTATDLVDFLGGGTRFNIIKEKHRGNLLSAINEPVREIMNESVITIQKKDSIDDARRVLIDNRIGYLPVLDGDKIIGVVSERDFVSLISKGLTEQKVGEYMSRDLILGTTGMKIEDISKVMVRNGFRRLPIVSEDKLVGIVTTRDIVSAFADRFSPDFLEIRIDRIMKKPVTTSPETTLSDAAKIMVDNGIGGLPVISDNKVVGIITERDILESNMA